ncbi:hypothetical protein M8J76_005830 [Diaphorina citri]|nr:hypothetical protein M8J76_005830 [Diaphorina citri]
MMLSDVNLLMEWPHMLPQKAYLLPFSCKIKALRAKTNTYIKTPVRGEEPVFVVTGRKEDVARAKREILSAADHFSALRASRKSGALSPLSPPTGVPGHVTIEVRVPYKVVGLVVGPKGATIKRIQHQTNTYIVTPSRDKEPVFEVTGAPDSVEIARQEIESHIIRRTGSCVTPAEAVLNGDDNSADLLASLCNSGLGSLGTILNYVNGTSGPASDSYGAGPGEFNFNMPLSSSQMNHHVFSGSSGCSSASSSSSSSACAPHSSTQLDLGSIWSGMSSLDKDEGLGDSPSFDASPVNPSSIWSYPPVSSTSPSGSISGSRQCYLCNDREVTHALIPCGHNFFCSECAERTCDFDRTCPMCRVPVNQAMRIIS